jgi:hypothetical protein
LEDDDMETTTRTEFIITGAYMVPPKRGVYRDDRYNCFLLYADGTTRDVGYTEDMLDALRWLDGQEVRLITEE